MMQQLAGLTFAAGVVTARPAAPRPAGPPEPPAHAAAARRVSGRLGCAGHHQAARRRKAQRRDRRRRAVKPTGQRGSSRMAIRTGPAAARRELRLRDRLHLEGLHRDGARRAGAGRARSRSTIRCRSTCRPAVEVPDAERTRRSRWAISPSRTPACRGCPTNFRPKDPTNPYADYSVAQMYDFSRGLPAHARPRRAIRVLESRRRTARARALARDGEIATRRWSASACGSRSG